MGTEPATSPGAGAEALGALAEHLRAERSLLAPLLAADPDPGASFGALAAAGPRTAGDPAGYALVVEAVREGYLLHFDAPRLFGGIDADLALLAGDYLYALGLDRLAAIGDVSAVAELSDLISLSAMLEAERAGPLAIDWLWTASTLAVAVGGSAEHEAVKLAIRSGKPAEPLARRSAESLAAAGSMTLPLAELAEAIHFAERENGDHARA